MATYAFDLYPANDPAGKPSTSLTGARLARLTVDGELVSGWYKHVGYGMGEGEIRIHTDHADATEANFAKRNYVMFVRTDGGDQQIGGFFLEEGDFAALSREERGGRILTYSGPGSMAILDRYVLGHSVYASGQTFRGDYNVQDQWTWVEEPYGAMLLRGVEEGKDHPDAFFAAIDTDFTRTRDSNNLLWDELTDYETPIGTSVLQMYADFLHFGLVAQMDAAFSLTAYRDIDEYRTDRTSATFAANKARFQAGTNILNDLPKRIAASQERSHVVIRDRTGDYQTFTTGGSGQPYMAFLKSDTTADDTAIAKMGALHLTRRAQYADQAVVRHIIGSGTGEYEPGPAGDYWVLDLVTLHTGTAQHDFDEQAIEVASIKFFHDEAGNWFAETEFGAQYIPSGLERFQAGISSTIRTIRALQLCTPTLVTEPSGWIPGDLLIVHAEQSHDSIPALAASFTAIGTGGNQTIGPLGQRTGYRILADGETTLDTWGEAFPGATSLTWVILRGQHGSDWIGKINGGGGNETFVRYLALTAPLDGAASRVVLFGVHANPNADVDAPTAYTNLGVGGLFATPRHGVHISDAEVASFAQTDVPAFPVTAGAYQSTSVEVIGASAGSLEVIAGGYDDNGALLPLQGSAATTILGDGREELVGTSVKAKRCDDTEHWHEVGAGSPTVNDDVDDGFRVGTLWVNDDNEMWLLTDNTAGAADWRGPLGSSGADLSAINFLVGTASGLLSAEIAVGTSPGGELGGTWASPTVDATHAGSAHHTRLHAITDVLDHSASGLTTGHVLTATSATAFAFQAAAGGSTYYEVLLTEDGTEPITTEDGLDWLYVEVPI